MRADRVHTRICRFVPTSALSLIPRYNNIIIIYFS
jgi:hypothetical protein